MLTAPMTSVLQPLQPGILRLQVGPGVGLEHLEGSLRREQCKVGDDLDSTSPREAESGVLGEG